MANKDIGAVRRALNVPVLLSNGSDTAWIAPAPKNAAIATRPGTAKAKSTVLPMENARKRTTGRSSPKVRFGPLKKYILTSFSAPCKLLFLRLQSMTYPFPLASS